MKEEITKTLIEDVTYHFSVLQNINKNAIKLCESFIAEKYSESIFPKQNELITENRETTDKRMTYMAGRITQLKEFERELDNMLLDISSAIRHTMSGIDN